MCLGPTAQCAAIACIGLALVPRLEDIRHRDDLTRRCFPLLAAAAAAAVWCGALLALTRTIDQCGQWARVLPRFSETALICLGVLLVGGIGGALVTLDSVGDLYLTGYGRVLLAKVVLTMGLVMLGWYSRTRWVPAARAHRTSAEVSRTRSRAELAVMAGAVALGAALAVTG